MRRFALSLTPFLVWACADEDELCQAESGRCHVIAPGEDAYEAAQTAFIEAEPGDVVYFLEGVFEMPLGLSVDTDGITVRGQGMDRTILSFAGQLDGAQGLLASGDDFTIEDLAIEDTVGDALKVIGADSVIIRRVRAEWTGGPDPDNGAYGLYPVQCKNVLIEDSIAIAASDAGVYVGQSENIVVRRNRALKNVAGIEIENSTGADVYGNFSMHNTGGVLVFNLPGLQMPGGQRTRVFDNVIASNNTPNFAPPGNIVGKVPTGTGLATIAAHEVEVFGNQIRDNLTANSAVISYLTTQLDYDDPDYDPYTDTIYFHDNVYAGGGEQPMGELGFLLTAGLIDVIDIEEDPLPDIIFDGFMSPDKSEDGMFKPEFNLCLARNEGASFGFLDVPNEFAGAHLDPSAYECEHEPLPRIELPEEMLR